MQGRFDILFPEKRKSMKKHNLSTEALCSAIVQLWKQSAWITWYPKDSLSTAQHYWWSWNYRKIFLWTKRTFTRPSDFFPHTSNISVVNFEEVQMFFFSLYHLKCSGTNYGISYDILPNLKSFVLYIKKPVGYNSQNKRIEQNETYKQFIWCYWNNIFTILTSTF